MAAPAARPAPKNLREAVQRAAGKLPPALSEEEVQMLRRQVFEAQRKREAEQERRNERANRVLEQVPMAEPVSGISGYGVAIGGGLNEARPATLMDEHIRSMRQHSVALDVQLARLNAALVRLLGTVPEPPSDGALQASKPPENTAEALHECEVRQCAAVAQLAELVNQLHSFV